MASSWKKEIFLFLYAGMFICDKDVLLEGKPLMAKGGEDC